MAANLAALRTVAALAAGQRPAGPAEQQVLARWSSWGAVPQIFDESRPEWQAEREQLRGLLDDDAYAAARRTTINAHYTDPAYVREVWDALDRLGFDGGRVLEPGVGAGTFVGMAPDTAEMTGVELDPTTAAIARALHPRATIRAESFAGSRWPAGHFDAVVGNVPFGEVRLHDPRDNRGGHAMHNHFIIKSLALTRPGGVVAVLTSHFTMDARNPAARREMNSMADLIGAVRLPSGAHRRAAGTEVVTDLLILRRRDPGTQPASTRWETARPVEVGDQVVAVNDYFRERPEHVLGEVAVGSGMYGGESLLVRAADLADTPRALRAALQEITAAALDRGQGFAPRPAAQLASEAAASVPALEDLWDGHLTARDDGSFTVVEAGVHAPLAVPRSQAAELTVLLGLRDAAKALLAAEAATLEDTAEIDVLREDLRDRYADYAQRYGPINRFTLRPTGRVDPDSGQARQARVVPRVMTTLRSDPFAALVTALEVFDDAAQTATPATLLTQRVVVPRTPVLGAETAADALAVSLESHGRVDLADVADLLGQDEREARAALGELVYDDPAGGRLIAAAEYLSGNVRDKLDAARTALADNPALAVNVAALEAVLPADLGMDDIEARLGAAWIDVDAHRQFLVDLLDDPSVRVEHPGGSIWEVRGATRSVAATSRWGTERMPATAIVKAALEQRPIQVTDDAGDGKRVLNPTETAAAQEKAGAIQERFAEWVWEEPDRAARLAGEYNRRFNSLVLRDYTAEGQRLTLPGLAMTFAPRPHQRTAVARMLSEPAVGLFHQVGAGKTAEMVMGTMELRRLGMAAKPVVVVPNHMLEQFSREWLQLYPRARLLAASSQDLAGDKRRSFVARTATNDWDAVIMTRSAFERIPMSRAAQDAYVDREADALRRMLDHARGGDGLTVKRLEKLVMAAEQRLEERLDGAKDAGITFEETGVDYLVVDEMHDYKNLRTTSNIRDAAIDGSRRATDLHMKLEYLRERHGERVVTAATATPIANSVTEAHVMQRYLRPDLLRAAGVEDFDAWAATFGQTVTEIEMAPTGGGNYRQQTRFAKFQNVPEMLRMWHVFADVKTAEDLRLPVPALWPRPDGERRPATVVIEASPEISAYVTQLGERAERVRSRAVEPEEDNMLKISTDGRKAALDMRLVTGEPSSTPSKLDVAADTVAGIWRNHRNREYVDVESGQPTATRGALQLVFCDLGTPSADWNAYDELRDQLTARGLPREQIRFIHEASNDVDKGRLFAAARAGKVAVLMGSTQKMGVGTNIQTRAVALHHLDCPWRPADLEQRDGRVLRQGNQNAEVGLYRYAVEGSFDAYSWQTVERKAKFIAQIMRGRLDVREMEDVGDNALSFAEVKALASGDPLILEKAHADSELTRLERLSRAHARNEQSLSRTIASAESRAATAERSLPVIHAAVAARRDTRGDAFAMTVTGRRTTSRSAAADLLRAWATTGRPAMADSVAPRSLGRIGELGDLPIDAAVRRELGGKPSVVFTLGGVAAAQVAVPLDKLHGDGIGVVRQLEHRIDDLPALAGRTGRMGEAATAEAAAARQALGQPFRHADALRETRARVAEIAQAMQEQQNPTAAAADASAVGGPALDADVLELQRLTQVNFPAAPQPGGRPAPPPTPSTTPRVVQRDREVERS